MHQHTNIHVQIVAAQLFIMRRKHATIRVTNYTLKLKKKVQQFKIFPFTRCLESGRKFVDPEFPPSSISLFLDSGDRDATIEWKRPGDLCEVRGKTYKNTNF